jgi:membrane fusion protein, multidrug efflux system
MNEHSPLPVETIERSPRSRRNALLTVLALVVVGILAWFLTRGGGEQGGFGGRRGRPPTTVGIAKVVGADVPQSFEAIGTVQPVVAATVRPQLAGTIFSINFTEGQNVREGQLLAQIDPRPYRLALAQAEANLARDEAQLNLARTNLRRFQTLLQQDSIARQEVDTQAASVKQVEGTVAADRAAVGTARLNLQYTSITAPVSGRIGLRLVDLGNYVTPGDANGVAVITQSSPIDVSFAVPQGNLPGILAKRGQGESLRVTARDQGGSTVIGEGRFLTFDNRIDAATGTVLAKARFANADGRLFPSQFVNISLAVDTLRNAATVPVTAVRHGTQGDFVFVLQADKTVKMRPIKAGPTSGTQVAILDGLKVGETVITEGADSLEDGATVVLPGEAREMRRREEKGFFGRLFGGGESAQPPAAGQGARNGQGGERRQQQAGGTAR